QKNLNLQSQAWERLVLLREAKKRKIDVSNREVVEAIASYPIFQRKGRFDNKQYNELLQYVFHAQPRIFEEQARGGIMLAKLYAQVTGDIKVNEEEIKEGYQKLNEEVSLYYIVSNPADFAKGLSISDQETKDYFNQNSLDFKQPLSFNIEYLLLDSEDKTNEAVSRINKKGDFYKIAKEMGYSIKETGLFIQIDPIPGIGWEPEILNLISKLKVGQFSPPIHIDKNYYILRLKERKETYIPDFEKVKEKAREKLIQDKSKKLAEDKINETLKLLKEAYGSDPKLINFDKIAKERGLKSDSTKFFKYGSYIEGIGGSDIFWEVAGKLKEGEPSGIIAIPSGFYIIKLKDRIPVDEKKFQSEKAEFSQKLLSQKKGGYFAKFIEQISRQSGIPQ
ncbi:MAG: peptidyl-prolyl cis-trans isomerase, partial [Candidatus Omnitrophica bacterium]|nr:peptidyl-prolyl cis-trans isomerase [Candidatus Omnitrophota bacterium]